MTILSNFSHATLLANKLFICTEINQVVFTPPAESLQTIAFQMFVVHH